MTTPTTSMARELPVGVSLQRAKEAVTVFVPPSARLIPVAVTRP